MTLGARITYSGIGPGTVVRINRHSETGAVLNLWLEFDMDKRTNTPPFVVAPDDPRLKTTTP